MESLRDISKRSLSLRQLNPTSRSLPQNAYSCEPCSDTGWLQVFDENGKSLGVKRCQCLTDRIRETALARIPQRYRRYTLETVKPLGQVHGKQGAVVPMLRDKPTASFLLFGKNGTGKSFCGWLLYRQAAEEGRPVVGMSVADLLGEYRACEFDRELMPTVDADSLRYSKHRWLVFLDEFEKARPTEFAAECLFRLVDAAYSNNHQLVITSNLRPAQLQEHWARASEHYGPSIMRRLFELEDAVSVEMF